MNAFEFLLSALLGLNGWFSTHPVALTVVILITSVFGVYLVALNLVLRPAALNRIRLYKRSEQYDEWKYEGRYRKNRGIKVKFLSFTAEISTMYVRKSGGEGKKAYWEKVEYGTFSKIEDKNSFEARYENAPRLRNRKPAMIWEEPGIYQNGSYEVDSLFHSDEKDEVLIAVRDWDGWKSWTWLMKALLVLEIASIAGIVFFTVRNSGSANEAMVEPTRVSSVGGPHIPVTPFPMPTKAIVPTQTPTPKIKEPVIITGDTITVDLDKDVRRKWLNDWLKSLPNPPVDPNVDKLMTALFSWIPKGSNVQVYQLPGLPGFALVTHLPDRTLVAVQTNEQMKPIGNPVRVLDEKLAVKANGMSWNLFWDKTQWNITNWPLFGATILEADPTLGFAVGH